MITICNGIVRSGSTWSYNVCRRLNEIAAMSAGEQFGQGYLDAPSLDKFLLAQSVQSVPSTVVKAHEVGPVALEFIRTRRALAVCTLRDPRDCIVSDMRFMNTPLEPALARVQDTLNGVSFFQDFGRTLFIRYEDMMQDRLTQISRIAIHMGISLTQEGIRDIDAATNIEASQKICDDLKARSQDEVRMVSGHRVDRSTHLHDNHLQGGKTGRWKDELPIDLARKLTKLFEPWLLKLGYETESSIRAFCPPEPQRRNRTMAMSAMMGGRR